jgi:lysophospholipase L1-like esterase
MRGKNLSIWLGVIILFVCFKGRSADHPEEMAVFRPGAKILFQGDSITDGNRGRTADPNHILGHGYVFIIAAKFGGEYPERNLTFINRGISGNKITDLQERWTNDTINLKPDVLSILIGVNDASSALQSTNGISVGQYEAKYDQLLQDTAAALPGVKIVLCEPFILPVGKVKDRWDEWQADIQKRQAVVEKLAAKYHLPVVHFQKVFDDACKRAPASYWIWDGVHPTYSGHQLMADEWVRVVEQFWKDGRP